ncbi:MAG: pyridoxamine 5'-phosphate oxidase [Chitinophagales bacterium]
MLSISELRKEYSKKSLSEDEVAADPFHQFERWWVEADESKIEELNAMTLATASSDGIPSARIVLLKGFDEAGFVFFTNYSSYKARQLEENPRASLVFFWKELERQVRITGLVEKLNASASDEYFDTRPEGSKIGAWTSPQSQVINGRSWLEDSERRFRQSFKGKKIHRPEAWGGYRVRPIQFEFWQGRENRLHDRLQFTLQEGGDWKIERLAP